MIVRYCAGGVVFYANKVLLVKNDRGEWTLPKGKIHQDELKHSSAVSRVKDETGVEASILETAGNTMYQFFSRSRQHLSISSQKILQLLPLLITMIFIIKLKKL